MLFFGLFCRQWSCNCTLITTFSGSYDEYEEVYQTSNFLRIHLDNSLVDFEVLKRLILKFHLFSHVSTVILMRSLLLHSALSLVLIRENEGELLASLWSDWLLHIMHLSHPVISLCRKLYIADARPRKNALANGAMGGGSESSSNYFQSPVSKWSSWFDVQHLDLLELLDFYWRCSFLQIVFFGIDNIHAMRESYSRLRDYLDMHGATSSDGRSSFLVSTECTETFCN